jgi:hypothetical protein
VRFIALLCAAALLPGTAAAGAWTREFGSGYAKFGADYYQPSAYVDPQTGEATDLRYFGQQYSVYVEMGVLPVHPMQVTASVPLSIGATSFGEGGRATTTRLGDARLAFQSALLQHGFQLSVAAEVKVPLYRNGDVGGDFGTYQAVFPYPGDGQIDLTERVLFGGSIPGVPAWAEGSVGYRHRTELFLGWEPGITLVDGVPYRASVGIRGGPLSAILNLDGIVNIRADLVTRAGASLGPTAMVTLWRGLALEGRVQRDLYARHAAVGWGYGLGISWRAPP